MPGIAAFGYQTFEVLSSCCRPGYAESAIVNGLLDLMDEARRRILNAGLQISGPNPAKNMQQPLPSDSQGAQ